MTNFIARCDDLIYVLGAIVCTVPSAISRIIHIEQVTVPGWAPHLCAASFYGGFSVCASRVVPILCSADNASAVFDGRVSSIARPCRFRKKCGPVMHFSNLEL